MPKILKFPQDFLWGVSTSAYQIEGGIENDWSEWENARIKNHESGIRENANFICGIACDSYNRYEEDLSLVKDLNCGAYRMGLEWSRLEPEPGNFNLEEVLHYRKVLQAAKAKNLKVVLTLWHWTNPLWFAAQGGWANPKAVKHFSRYVGLVARDLGEYVDYWVTINEPMVHVANGYLTAKFPPNKKNVFSAWRAGDNLIKAHGAGYKIIHEHFKEAKVGLTMLTNYFEPAHAVNPLEFAFAKLANYCWNDRFIKKLHGQYDFLGLDYYFHDRVIWRSPFKENLNRQVTDLGWEIYPQGIYRVLKNYAKFRKPLFIMENGLADAADKKRGKFIADHLKYAHQAISEGVDVRGYFYWSLLDNFEWAEGFAPKFGLYAVDRKTLARAPRPSAKLYAEICKNNQLKFQPL
ncbi:MAG: glycoside hydrolase family 1 protein [Patescibacteria group bacterium]|nr:glycoside hydrolase family 1 protein [Patescibacteria group bacterium]